MATKTLYVLVQDGGDSSYSVCYTMDPEVIEQRRVAYNNDELEHGEPGVDGDGFHFSTINVPEDATYESLGISEWPKRKLAPQLEALVKTCVREASDELFKDKTGQQVMDAVRVEARRQMEVSARDLANTMRQEIRGMIREEIRGMLGGKE
jgi:hypothetical protein